jgi:glycerol-3-phosphate dehydrogenase (NAD(P)+)
MSVRFLGPTLAEEIAEQQFAGTVIATHHQQDALMVQDVMRNDTLRVYASADVYGVELGGALKNIYAIVCGLAAGLQVGQNTIGLLITRALAEMSRFAVSMGGNPFTFLGLAGVGDLLVTCTSPLSRNHRLGRLHCSRYVAGRGVGIAGQAGRRREHPAASACQEP